MRKTTIKRTQLNSSKASPAIKSRVATLVTDAMWDQVYDDMNDAISVVSNELLNDPRYNKAWMGLYDARFPNSVSGDDMEPILEDRIKDAINELVEVWVDFYLYHADEDVNSNRRINSNRGSRRLNSSRHLPYQAISIPVILRDWDDLADNEYYSPTHKKLVDIGDTLYNDGIGMAEYLKPEFKKLYEEYGEAFWKEVIKDAAAIDSQMSRDKIKDLKDELIEISFKVM